VEVAQASRINDLCTANTTLASGMPQTVLNSTTLFCMLPCMYCLTFYIKPSNTRCFMGSPSYHMFYGKSLVSCFMGSPSCVLWEVPRVICFIGSPSCMFYGKSLVSCFMGSPSYHMFYGKSLISYVLWEVPHIMFYGKSLISYVLFTLRLVPPL